LNKQKKILICPLDWGLGHATRCIPLIDYFLQQGCEVMVAGNEITNSLIKTEFPALTFLDLKGYRVKYASSAWGLPFVIGRQIPRLLQTIRFEHQWLQQTIDTYAIDLVIADNRYGLYSTKVPCIFITHQLQIAVPQSSIIQKWVNAMNHRMIKKFSAIWVPDVEDHAMSGKLSTQSSQLANVYFIGNLSRFNLTKSAPLKYKIMVLLSGPEPQRSQLEALILAQLQHNNDPILIVRGKLNAQPLMSNNKQIHIVNHLSKNDLQMALMQSAMIICRSGYSTIMDLMKLHKHAFLIPTPGQTEQEYLATYLAEKRWFLTESQSALDVNEAVKQFNAFSFEPLPDLATEGYKKAIDQWLQS
jgi:uncharacterized protein (TIGR00661 family)